MIDTHSAMATAVVDAQISAYVAGDATRFAQHYAQDAVCMSLPREKIVASGRDEIERVWGVLFARRSVDFELVNRIALGDFVVDHERIINRETGAIIEAIATYEVRDGLIQRVWFFEPHA
jgi:hypothetical protein